MRIRTDGEYQYRIDVIEKAADRLDCNKTKAVITSCDVTGRLLDDLETALVEMDLRPSERDELADRLSSRYIEIDVTPGAVEIDID